MFGGVAAINIRTLIPIVIFITGIGLVISAVITGEAEVHLFLIFPVFTGSGWMFMTGVLLIALSFVVGFALLMLGQRAAHELAADYEPPGARPEPRTETKYGGAVLIGPVPIAFGSDMKIAFWMLVAVIVLGIVLFALLLLAL